MQQWLLTWPWGDLCLYHDPFLLVVSFSYRTCVPCSVEKARLLAGAAEE